MKRIGSKGLAKKGSTRAKSARSVTRQKKVKLLAVRSHELEQLIAAKFPPEGKAQRVAAALRVLETLRFGIPIDIETAKWAGKDPELEDF